MDINLKTKPVFQALMAIPAPAVEFAVENPNQPPLQGICSDGEHILGVMQHYWDEQVLTSARMAAIFAAAHTVHA